MEPVTTLLFIEVILVYTTSAIQKQQRKRILLKWANGTMTMKELLWLKKQTWFQKAFHKVQVSEEKKNT